MYDNTSAPPFLDGIDPDIAACATNGCPGNCGSMLKVDVLAARREMGLPLWNPDDSELVEWKGCANPKARPGTADSRILLHLVNVTVRDEVSIFGQGVRRSVGSAYD